MIVITLAASLAGMPSVSARSRVVQVSSPRVSLRKLITAVAGTDGMRSPGVLDLLVAIFICERLLQNFITVAAQNFSENEKDFAPQNTNLPAVPPIDA